MTSRTKQGAAADATDHTLERLVFFSDAVFAIAITLLIIEVRVPRLPAGASDSDYVRALVELTPSFIGYGLSFAVIGTFWASHHRVFASTVRHDSRIVAWNLALLAAIAFMPFPTAFISASAGARVPALLYCATLIVAGLLNMRVVWIATGPTMADPSLAPEQRRQLRLRRLSVTLGAATAFVCCIVALRWGLFALATIPLWRRVLTRGAERSAAD